MSRERMKGVYGKGWLENLRGGCILAVCKKHRESGILLTRNRTVKCFAAN